MKHIVITDHYTFDIDIKKETSGPIDTYVLQVGDAEKPCLHAIVPLKPKRNNNYQRFYNLIRHATLPNIEALRECLSENVSDKYFRDHSFGKEMLYALIRVITNIPEFRHITYIKLTDASYIPCNRKLNDNLDLITYNIALYGVTWYEANFNATAFPDTSSKEEVSASLQEERLSGKKRPREEPQTSEAGLDVSSPVLLGSEPPCSTATSSVRPQTSSEEEPQPSEAADEPPTKWLRSSSVEPCDILLGLENH